MTRRGWIAAGCLLLTVAACSRPDASPLPATTLGARPSLSPTPRATTPTATPTPSSTTTEPPAVQQFTLDDAAEFDDGLVIEIAGSVADKAKKADKGAATTKGQIVTASVRIENGTKHTYDAAPVEITATYGGGTSAEAIVDKTDQLQRGFAGKIKPNDESIATIGFAVPYTQLKRVTFIIDPADDEHDPVSFTGEVRHL